MKVKKFIEILQEFNQDAEVILVNDITGTVADYDEEPGWNCGDVDREAEGYEEYMKKKKMSVPEIFFHFWRSVENGRPKEKNNEK